ncbi:hypothetical protein ACHAWU_004501 [Discostella pseudostelligera]|uniref:Uncharacterized protein n=1 Tax=Discostella pseudostelligera TaxID=259834 RepID=A0ABD3MVN0_9STRA
MMYKCKVNNIDNIYEAVMVVDEELGMKGASGKKAIPSSTVTVPSTDETGDDIVSLHRRSLTVIINTIVNVCMLSIDLSNMDAYLVYGAAAVALIGLVLMKLYLSYVFLQLYFLGFMLMKFSDVPMSDAITSFMLVIAWCNFLVIFFLALDKHFNKTERDKMESIITLTILLVIPLLSP